MPDETSPLLRGAVTCDRIAERQADEQPRISYLRVLLPMAMGVFIFATNQTLIVACYPSIGNEFKQLQNTSWIATSYLVTVTSFQPMYGKLSDFYGRKTCLLFAYIVLAVGSLFCGLSRNLNELIVSRAIAGIGGGGIQTLVSIILSDIVPLRNRGTSQGVLNILWAAGNSFGASFGGILSDTIGWRWIFLLQVPLTLAAFMSVSVFLRLPKRESGDFVSNLKRIDFVGVITLALSLVMLLYGMDVGGNISWSDCRTVTSLLAGGVLFALFLFYEMEFAREPFAPKRIIINRGLVASYFVNSFSTASSYCMLFYLPLFFQAVQKKSASETGLWLLISVGATVAGSFVGGLTIQSTGKYYGITVIAYGVSLCGTIVATLATSILRLSSGGLGVGIFLISFGNGCGITTCLISIIANAGKEDQAIATAVSYLFRSLGMLVGLSTGSTVVQSVLRSSLREKLSGVDVDEIARKVRESLKYLDELDPVIAHSVRESYAEAVHVAMYFCIGIATIGFMTTLFIRVINIEH